MTSSGRRRPTMADVAQEAGVSAMTVSYVYSQPDRVAPGTAAAVRAVAERLGYPGPHPGARSLRRGRAGALGVVLGEHLTYAFDDPQAVRFLAGVAEVCAEHAVGLTLVPVTGGATDAARVADAAVDGFVVWTTTDDDPVLDTVVATGLPAVIHGGPARAGLPAVAIDDRAAARAIGRLAFADSRRPAVLSFPLDRQRRSSIELGPDPQDATFPVTRHRLEGLRDAWLERDGSWSDVRVAICATNSTDAGEAHARTLLKDDPPPDAIAAMSDELALGAMRAVAQAGVAVPEALALTGWDGSPAAARAELTTLSQSLREQGADCARQVLESTKPGAQESTARWQVIERRSTRN